MLGQYNNLDNDIRPLSFGQDAEFLIGQCFENTSSNEIFLDLEKGILANSHEGQRASLIIFLELIMRQHCLKRDIPLKVSLKEINIDFETALEDSMVNGKTGIIHQTDELLCMKALIHDREKLIMSATAIWYFTK